MKLAYRVAALLLSVTLSTQGFAQSAGPTLKDLIFTSGPYMLPSFDQQEQAISNLLSGTQVTCNTATVTAYDLQGFWYPATVRACPNAIDDLSTGNLALMPGQRLFFVEFRGQRGSLYSFQRGYPNTPYDFVRPDDKDESGYSGVYSAQQPTRFTQDLYTLPFVPFAVYEYPLNSGPKYAFGDLKILPGHESQAYPLNSDSIITMVNGVPFGSTDALAAMFATPPDPAMPYAEVFYIQKSEHPQRVRHAFIPWLTIAQAGPAWKSLAAQTPVGPSAQGTFGPGTLGRVAALATLFGLWVLFEQTGIPDQWRQEQEECHRRQGGGQIVLC